VLDTEDLFQQAFEHHQKKELEEAATYYQELLERQPDHSDARANYAQLLKAQGKDAQALEEFAIASKAPDVKAPLFLNWGNLLLLKEDYNNALEAFKRGLAIDDALPQLYLGLAMAYFHRGDVQDALKYFKESVRRNDTLWRGWEGIGRCLSMSEPKNAISAYREAIKRKPDQPSLWLELGQLYLTMKNWHLAAQAFDRASKKSTPTQLLLTLQAKAAWMMGEHDAAIGFLRDAVAAEPHNTSALLNLAKNLEDVYELSEALEVIQQLLKITPNEQEAFARKGSVYWKWGRMADALECLQMALTLQPDNLPLKQMIAYAALHNEGASTEEVLRLQAMPFEALAVKPKPPCQYQAGQKINLGFVSPDLHGDHPMAQFMQTYFQFHHHDAFNIHVFYANEIFDRTTESMQKLVGHWHDITHQSDEEAAHHIRDHHIDFLIDLAGHSARNRLNIFRERPCAKQAIFLGYPSTTGCEATDFLFADEILCPEGKQRLYREKIVWIEGGAFPSPYLDPSLTVRHVGTHDAIVFGNFSRCSKYSPKTVKLWARVLNAIPESRLRLKSGSFFDPKVQDYWYKVFESHGVKRDRVELRPPSPFHAMLKEYQEVDVVLDTLTYSGGTTTMHALWMGVPVISMPGDLFHSRMSASILMHHRMEENVVDSEEDFLARCQDYASNIQELRRARSRLIPESKQDGKKFAEAFETSISNCLLAS